MQRFFFLLALTAMACDKPAPTAEPVPAEEQTRIAIDDGRPEAIRAPDPEAASPLDSPAAFEVWKKSMQTALDDKKWDAAQALMKSIDPGFDATFLKAVDTQKVESFEGQLDATDSKEWVIQVRQHGQFEGHGEHEDFYWIGVVAEVDGTRKLVGSITRPLLLVCEFADRAGLTFGFAAKTPGPDAALWVVEQDVQSCGTLIEVHYKKTEHRLQNSKLVAKKVKAPSSVEYDRMEHMRDNH